MKKTLVALTSACVVLSACSDSEEQPDSSAFTESAASCFDLASSSSSGSPDAGAIRYEVDENTPPTITLVDGEVDYSGYDYDEEPAANALFDGLENDDFPSAVIPLDKIVSGGVSPDGIPAIDEPEFASLSEIDFIDNCNEAVVSVEANGDAVAFPIRVLISHEIVNTEIGGVPISVTYCPLCNSALAFDRRVGDRVLDFGVSGSLYNSALLMYDRPTGSLWSHFTGEGVVGHYAGVKLPLVPAQTVSYGQFVEANPQGRVLTENNEHSRSGSYGLNPYTNEDSSDGVSGFLFDGEVDERLERKERVVGVVFEGKAFAVPFELLRESGTARLTEKNSDLVVFYAEGLASPVDKAQIAEGRDVGQSGVFIPEVDGQELTFAKASEEEVLFKDNETGSSWNIFGQATDGPLTGASLKPVSHLDAFWFAWAAYRPDTIIIEQADSEAKTANQTSN